MKTEKEKKQRISDSMTLALSHSLQREWFRHTVTNILDFRLSKCELKMNSNVNYPDFVICLDYVAI